MISTIEGVGNEVIQFFIFLGIVLICLLLWLSTRVRSQDEPFFSTVYVLERRYGRTSEEPARVPHPTENNTEGNQGLSSSSNNRCVVASNRGSSDESTASASHQGDQSICTTDGAATAGCSPQLAESSSPCSSRGPSSNDSASKSEPSEDTAEDQIELMIKVRLKYFTDESREVEGSLNERLSDFKRRNFPEELAAGKIIRLIFNGRMLRDDNITLQNYGLFDDCVVHCLIGNEKPQQPAAPEQPDQSQQFPQNNEQATVPEWNLSKLLCILIVGILSLTWYCRFQFATLFTFTSTSFLLGLTVIFLCSMFGTFYVDSVPLNTVG
ncbi:hypothetical protein V9T40_006597 [Parthenolecanium corni]|uniref:Ubiquitin-like domain-containing protein n=1 Tax=Parthenolecanium corni TaxID=536013 RepID=A0AAN9TMK0_9HEMI